MTGHRFHVVDVFARRTYAGNQLAVLEDPATGSSNGCLAAYLVRHDVLGTGPLEARVEQGLEMGRPSLLFLRASEDDGEIAVEVGGSVVPVAEGTLL